MAWVLLKLDTLRVRTVRGRGVARRRRRACRPCRPAGDSALRRFKLGACCYLRQHESGDSAEHYLRQALDRDSRGPGVRTETLLW